MRRADRTVGGNWKLMDDGSSREILSVDRYYNPLFNSNMAATEQAPKSIEDLKTLLKDDIKVKVAGMNPDLLQ